MTFDANNLDERLAPIASTYRDTKVREPGELPPDGDYQARVEKFDIWESKKQELFLSTILMVVGGPENRAEIKIVNSLENTDRLDFLKRLLLTLGVEDPNELSGLRSRLGDVVGRIVEVRVATASKINESTGQPYRNAYVNKVISMTGSDIPVDTSDFKPAAAGAFADDDIPF